MAQIRQDYWHSARESLLGLQNVIFADNGSTRTYVHNALDLCVEWITSPSLRLLFKSHLLRSTPSGLKLRTGIARQEANTDSLCTRHLWTSRFAILLAFCCGGESELNEGVEELRQAAATDSHDARAFTLIWAGCCSCEAPTMRPIAEFQKTVYLILNQAVAHRALASALLFAGQNAQVKIEGETVEGLQEEGQGR